MKKKIALALIALGSSLFASVPTSGLIGAWPFSGNANDVSGSGNNGTVTGATLTNNRCGTPNSAYHFNGSSNYITMLTGGPLGNASRSISFWARSTNTNAGGFSNVRSVFDYGTANAASGSYEVCWNYCTNGLGIDNSNMAFIAGGNACLQFGAWHHYALVYDNTVSTLLTSVAVYVDGVLQSVVCTVGGGNSINTVAGFPITIGKACNSLARFFDGDIDDVYLYNRALTTTEINQLYTDLSCPPAISGPSVICSTSTYSIAPFVGANSYAWTLPSGWSGTSSTNVINVTPGTGSGTVKVNVIDNCGNVIATGTLAVTAASIAVTASNVSLCINAASCTTISATATFTGAVTYSWTGIGTGQSQVVCPTATTIYTVTGTASGGVCQSTATMAVNVTTNCCSSSTTGLSVLPVNPPVSVTGGSWLINSNIVLTNSSNWATAEFLIMPGAQITVQAGFNLDLNQVHLYSCGLIMWKGIVVQDGGSISSNRKNYSLVEDAITAVDLSGVSTAHAALPISLTNVTFNKNYVGIHIANSVAPVTTLPILLQGCVFTSRNLPFTSTTWPSPFTTGGGLRTATSATTGLIPPYLGTGPAISNLKSPYTNQPANIGIKIENFGVTSGLPTNAGVDIGVTYAPAIAQFNLFDALGEGIETTDASLTTLNNVFQNMQYMPSGFGGQGIVAQTTGLMNARLDLRTTAPNQVIDYGNRFWNCYDGIIANSIYEMQMDYGVFRSTQNTGSTFYAPGASGIKAKTDRFTYNINNCQLNNINTAIDMNFVSGSYNVGGGSITGIYANGLNLTQNYFGAEVSSSTPLGPEYVNTSINLTGSGAASWNMVTGGLVAGNKIDRAFRGIMVNGMSNYPLTIGGNLIHLTDDGVFSAQQYAVEAINNQGNLAVKENTCSAISTTNPLVALMYFGNNSAPAGSTSPLVQCNIMSDSYYAFRFDGSNANTLWKSNDMTNHWAGLVLSSNGIIGTQGAAGTPASNRWLGTTWAPAGPWHTFCISSNANLSVLWVNNVFPFFPSFDGGTTIPYNPTSGVNVMRTTGGSDCISSGYPTPPNLRTMQPTSIEQIRNSSWSADVFPNPSNGNISISSALQSEDLSVRISDLSGRVLYNKTVTTQNYLTSLELPGSEAIYFIEITNSDHQTVHKKVIVNK